MDLVIYDCEGVLIDSELIACSAEADALSKIGYHITSDRVVERFAGMPSDAMYEIIGSELGQALPGGFGTQVKQKGSWKVSDRTARHRRGRTGSVIAAGAKYVASSSSPAKLAVGLVETGLFELLYPNVFSTALVERGKPHPDLFLYAANAMSAEVSDCIVVEDSIAGVTAARNAGMRSIGFVGGSHCGPGHSDKLLEAGAETVIDDLRLLLDEVV